MERQSSRSSVPPLLAALQAAHAALDAATVRDEHGRASGWVSTEGMTFEQLAQAVRLQAELEGRVAGLRLHTVAGAEAVDAASTVAAVDTSAWAASAAGRNRSRSWGAVWLARLLDEKYAHVRSALTTGRISEEHAAIIVRAAEELPDGVDPRALADCEAIMATKAETMTPRNLRRAVRRLLAPLSEELADRHEGHLVQAEERRAEAESWLVLGDNGDGTWSGRFVVPELHAHLLKNALEQLSAPRRVGRNAAGETVEDESVQVVGYAERLGAAFLELCEHLPADGHTRSGITMVVHVAEERLRAGDGVGRLETGVAVSVEALRRLACEAGIVPLVLGGRSQPLDLGTTSRLFSRAQRVALSARFDACAAEGCDRPFAWTELHHKLPWGRGGPTDLDNAVPLCGYHHRRVHDPSYEHTWLDSGEVRLTHRWASRRRRSAHQVAA